METESSNSSAAVSRRQFIKSSSLVAATAAVAANFPAVLSGQASLEINAVIIGVGGRGGDAGKNFLDAAEQAGVKGKIVAVADIFPEQANRAQRQFGVPADKLEGGLAALARALGQGRHNRI